MAVGHRRGGLPLCSHLAIKLDALSETMSNFEILFGSKRALIVNLSLQHVQISVSEFLKSLQFNTTRIF